VGGPSKQVEQAQTNLANEQAAQAASLASVSQQSLNQMNTLTAPAIQYNQGIVSAANAGNYSGLIQAAGPATGAITQQATQAKQNILNQIPAGAGQQAALAQLPYQTANAEASTLNNSYNSALQNLTQIGAAYGGVGLQSAGASTSAANSGQAGYQAVGNEQAQAKSDVTGLLGSAATGLGQAASGKL